MDFVVELRHVLNFLQQNGFDKAAEAVYEKLETAESDNKPAPDAEERDDSPSSAPEYAGDYPDQPIEEEYRSKSAEPVLVSSRGASEGDDDASGRGTKEPSSWYPPEPLTTRLSGSSRLYEDPDIDEYDSMDDLGYIRRPVHNQQDFITYQLDLLQDNDVEPYYHSSNQQYGPRDSVLSDSGSSSASLSSPGMSSCKQHPSHSSLSHDNSQQQDQLHSSARNTAPTGDAAWDSGPAGIVFAEPVTTPTKESGHNSMSEKPCLSRVESLSNSFIDELESCDGHGEGSRLSEAGSVSGELGTPSRHSRATSDSAAEASQRTTADYDDVIDLSPPSPPPDCAADAGIDLSNIFELGLRGSSRTSSVDVLYGSVRNWNEPDSEAAPVDDKQRQLGSNSKSRPGLLVAAVAGSAASKQKPSSVQQSEAEQQTQQQQEPTEPQQLQQRTQQQEFELVQQQLQVQDHLQQQVPQQHTAAQQQQDLQQSEPQLDSSSIQQPSLTLSTTPSPAAAAGGGFGFSFPTTPPSAVDAAVHEERAERVFSTWASNHSRTGLEGEEEEHSTSSRKPSVITDSGSSSRRNSGVLKGDAAEPADTSWEFPMTPAVVKPAAAAAPALLPLAPAVAAAAPSETAADASDSSAAQSATAKTAGATAGSGTAAAASKGVSAAADAVTLAAPVTPFSPGSAAAATKRSSSGQLEGPASTRSRGGSRPHSSSVGHRAAAAGGSGSSSRHKGSSPWGKPLLAAAAAAAGSGSRRSSPLTDGAASEQTRLYGGPAVGGGYVGPLGEPMSAPATDADMASTGTGGFSGSGELGAPRYVVDEAGNLLYEYDSAYVESRYETFDLRIIHRRRRTGFEDSKEFPIRKNDLIAGRYQVMDFLGSAAFSQAVQALDTATGALVCLKIIKNNKDYFDQSLDEIKLLRYVNGADPEDEHHIVRLYDFFYYKEHLILVCELLRANLYEFQKYQRENGDEPYFTPPRIQKIAVQVLQSLAYLHSLGLVHSDLKPENILIKSYSRCEVKVIDLGSSCFITDHLSSYVQSRSYRAPEVILGLAYGQKIDIWSLGCILAELATGYVLFQNDSLATLLVRLEGILGPLPSWMISQGRYSNRYYTRSRQLYERNKPNGRYELLVPKQTSLRHRVPVADEGFLDFLSYLLTPDPTARPSAEEALQHPWLNYPYPPVEQIPD